MAAITELAARDERVMLLVGDLGFKLWDDFRSRFPDRWYNCGIAEANMVSVAVGLVLAGMRPFVYSIASFVTYRCYEQIRVDVCYHNLPMVIVGVGAGLSYARLGPTHHACEDVAVMRALPDMTVVVPCDPVETREAVKGVGDIGGPVYLRLGKNGEPVLRESELDMLRPAMLRVSSHAYIVASGPIVSVAIEASKRLQLAGKSVGVFSWPVIKPLDDDTLFDLFGNSELVITLEEHSLVGGLGSALAEWKIDKEFSTPMLCFGVPDAFLHNVGDRSQALAACGLTADNIAGKILEALK